MELLRDNCPKKGKICVCFRPKRKKGIFAFLKKKKFIQSPFRTIRNQIEKPF